MTKYTIVCPDGVNRGIEVEPFKEATEKYIRERIQQDDRLPLIIKQRLYKDGRWTIRIYNPYYPYKDLYRKRYDFSWNYYDIKELLNKIIEDYEEWISLHE